MRIALLANPDNLHVQRWIAFLAGCGHELLVVADPGAGFRPPGAEWAPWRWNLATKVLAGKLTPEPHGLSLWKFLHIRPILREFAPDVVHAMEAYANGLALARCGPYPKVLTPWGKDIHHDAFKGPVWRALVAAGLNAADRISTNDPGLGPFLEEQFGIAPEKVHPFSWGADLSIFRPGLAAEAARWRRRLSIEEGAPVVLSPRHLDPYWGAGTVMEAIPEVVRRHPGTVFVMTARAWGAPDGFKADMRARAVRLGVEGAIRWVENRVDQGELAGLFNLADVFVSVPKTDLLAITVLEGMACGSYPVLGDLPAYAPHLRVKMPSGGESAAAVKPHDDPGALAEAICGALGNAALRRDAAEFNAARMVEMEDCRKNMAEMEVVYGEAIEAYRQKALP